MKFLFDFFPVLFFFIAYKLFGIFTATVVAIVSSFLQIVFHFVQYKLRCRSNDLNSNVSEGWNQNQKNTKFELTHLITFGLIIVLGGATLLFKNVIFIKLKPTAIYWVLALVFFGSQLFGKQTVIQKMLGSKLNLPSKVWRNLNLSWVMFFIIVGAINLFVVYYFSTDFWVNFKLFGVLGLTLLFGFAQSLYMARYAESKVEEGSD